MNPGPSGPVASFRAVKVTQAALRQSSLESSSLGSRNSFRSGPKFFPEVSASDPRSPGLLSHMSYVPWELGLHPSCSRASCTQASSQPVGPLGLVLGLSLTRSRTPGNLQAS